MVNSSVGVATSSLPLMCSKHDRTPPSLEQAKSDSSASIFHKVQKQGRHAFPDTASSKPVGYTWPALAAMCCCI
jgi:hypothetical protein